MRSWRDTVVPPLTFAQRHEGFIAVSVKVFPKSLLPLAGGEGGRSRRAGR